MPASAINGALGILDLFESKNSTEIIFIRAGEKLHESLLTIDELRNTYESEYDYILMESKELTIVIVTFKSEEKITKCLKSMG